MLILLDDADADADMYINNNGDNDHNDDSDDAFPHFLTRAHPLAPKVNRHDMHTVQE